MYDKKQSFYWYQYEEGLQKCVFRKFQRKRGCVIVFSPLYRVIVQKTATKQLEISETTKLFDVFTAIGNLKVWKKGKTLHH